MSKGALAVLMLACLLALAIILAGAGVALAEEEEEEVVAFAVEVQVLNFDGEPLEGALVEALNATSEERELINSTQTNSTGWATLWVPNGTTCDIEVVWKEALVGSIEEVYVESNMTLEPVKCSVCDLVVRTVTEDGRPVMRARVSVLGNYTNREGNYTALKEALYTNSSGICVLENALMECNYTIRAYRHGLPEPFEERRLWRLNATTIVNMTCPFLTVKVSVVDEQMKPMVGARVEVVDWGTGEEISEATVNEKGLAMVRALFGRNIIRALEDDLVLSEVVLNVAENETWCLLIGKTFNFTLDVSVKDALGTPLAGLKVCLLDEEGTMLATAETGPDGLATFTGLRPGRYVVEVLRGGEVLAREGLSLSRSTRIELRIGDRALILGALVRIPELLASSVVAATALATALVIWLWGKMARAKKTL